jgi:hypothetical protein
MDASAVGSSSGSAASTSLGSGPSGHLPGLWWRLESAYNAPENCQQGTHVEVNIEYPLCKLLSPYCSANAIGLLNSLNPHVGQFDVAHVKQQLREAIEHSTISPEDYENVTDVNYDMQEELNIRFREIREKAFDEAYCASDPA